MGKVLIIGCGGVASVALHKCCQNSEVFEEICIASRTKEKCDALKEKLQGTTKTKITTARVDANNVDELVNLINEVKPMRYKRSVQTILTFPHFLSWVIVAGIMMNILANNGAVNNLLATMGLEKYNFLTDKGLFRYILVFTLSWKEAGWSCILYIAAITGIDPSLYEAATIDGANRWHKILHITWPGILPVVLITLILRVGSMMDAGFDQVMNLYNNTVLDVADILDTYIYRITFQRMPNYGFSTAVGLFKGLTNCILLLSVNAVCKKINGTTIM